MFKTRILGYILTNPFSRVRQETSSRLDPNIDSSYGVFIDRFAYQPAAFPGLTVCVKYYIIRRPGFGSPNAATTLKSKSRNIAYYVTSIQSPAREV